MKTYCAFLRGVNIGGKTMKMAEACDALKTAGLTGKGATLDSGFSKILGSKSMKDKFTSRNIQTVARVAAKMA
jgi:uncharacterized protein (DUF1697 family)